MISTSKTVTIRIPDDTYRTLIDEADDRDASLSEVLRERIEKKMQYDDLETEVGRLRNERWVLVEDRNERTELREYVEEERTWREAGLGTRIKWWLFGKDRDEGKGEV